MIEGACVYRNDYDIPVLKMYKEIYNGYIFEVLYSESKIKINYIKSKKFTALFPKNTFHVVYKLPYYEVDIHDNLSIYKIVDLWINYIKPFLYK